MYSGAAVAEIAAGNLAYATNHYGYSWCAFRPLPVLRARRPPGAAEALTLPASLERDNPARPACSRLQAPASPTAELGSPAHPRPAPPRRRLVPVCMGIAMFVLGVAIPLLVREPAKGRYTPLNKARRGCCT